MFGGFAPLSFKSAQELISELDDFIQVEEQIGMPKVGITHISFIHGST